MRIYGGKMNSFTKKRKLLVGQGIICRLSEYLVRQHPDQQLGIELMHI
jgi:hypothetical protein